MCRVTCERVGKPQCRNTLGIFCPTFLLETGKSGLCAGAGAGRVPWGIWSVILVSNRRELILIIQTNGALSKFVLGDDFTLLGSTVFGVAWKEAKKEHFKISNISDHIWMARVLTIKKQASFKQESLDNNTNSWTYTHYLQLCLIAIKHKVYWLCSF